MVWRGGFGGRFWGAPGPPGSGGKVDLAAKSVVAEWLGFEGGLRRPILGGPRGAPPGSGVTVDLVVKRVVIDLRLGSWVVGTEKHGPAQRGPSCELCSNQFINGYLYGVMTNARC